MQAIFWGLVRLILLLFYFIEGSGDRCMRVSVTGMGLPMSLPNKLFAVSVELRVR